MNENIKSVYVASDEERFNQEIGNTSSPDLLNRDTKEKNVTKNEVIKINVKPLNNNLIEKGKNTSINNRMSPNYNTFDEEEKKMEKKSEEKLSSERMENNPFNEIHLINEFASENPKEEGPFKYDD